MINRTFKIVFESYRNSDNTLKYKQFRDTQEGKDALSEIHLIVKNEILSRFSIIGKIYNKQEIENLLTINELDFVDKSIEMICKENSLVLFTNDRDFKNTDLEILTGNSNILN
ncbi:hypothetical protein AGMMS49525_09880 [Bacteroidia bacterium]|nr:hypothetical protein AGMMS49525_09880 [Bacteroidia bacterium]